MRVAVLLSGVLLLLSAACDDDASTRSSSDAGGADASTDGGTEAGQVAEGAAYDQGVYHCCARGDDCCADREPGLCFQYGGVTGDCAEQGEMVEGKDICAHCCQGLERAEPLAVSNVPSVPPECESTAPPSLFVCVLCGDGVCGEGENWCICPNDCQGQSQ